MAATSTGPRYAPPDPTLPKPWRELIDGDTGNHYFWNPETGVTQYDRPGGEILPPPPPGPPPRKRDRDDDKHCSGWRSHRGKKRSEHHYRAADVGDGSAADVGDCSAAEAYRRKHEIVVRGNDVPDPFTTFEATDFPAELLREHVEVITPGEKQRRLEQILRSQDRDSKVLIFCSTKRLCEELSRNLRRFGAAAIHGDKSQGERDRVLSQFRSGRSPILVATDVASRGLDIKDIRARGRCRSRSFSPSSMKRLVGHGNSRSFSILSPTKSRGNSRSRSPRRSICQGVSRDAGPVRKYSSLSKRESSTDDTSSSRSRSRGNSRSRSPRRSISQGVSRDAGPVRKYSSLSKRESSTDNTSSSRSRRHSHSFSSLSSTKSRGNSCSRSPRRSISQGVSRDAGPVRKYSSLSKRESSTDNTSSSRSRRHSHSRSRSRSISHGYNRASVPARTLSPALLDQNLKTSPKHHGNGEETDEDVSQKTLDGVLRTLLLSPEKGEEMEDLIQETGPNYRGDDDAKEAGKGPVGTQLPCPDNEEEIEEGMISDD